MGPVSQYLNETARDLTVTTLGMRLTASYQWCMVSPGASRGMPDSLHQRLCPFIPTWGFLGTVWWLSSRGHPTVCLGLPCKVSNQSIVGLSPLAETTYSTSHEIPNDGSWWISCLINCMVQPWLYYIANLVKIKPTRTCAKILKVSTYSLLLFSKRNLVAKSLSCLELGK
jgi:hypothetical protein